MEDLFRLYNEWAGCAPQNVEQLPGAGSNRTYYRFTSSEGKTLIGVKGTSREENEAFIYLSGHFGRCGLSVPQIVAVSAGRLCYLQSDLGRLSLFDALAGGRGRGGSYNEEERMLLRRTIAELPRIQFADIENLDFGRCYPISSMDKTSVFFDLNYFKYCFLKSTGLDFNEVRLQRDFEAMCADLLDDEERHAFQYRDFQARNVMLNEEGRPYFIDYQGGRRGPVEYDVASFLWQASARYPSALREELIQVYADAARSFTNMDEVRFKERMRLFVLFRTLQVLGAYGFRGFFERKKYFLDSIEPAIRNLRGLLAEGACPYPYLYELLSRMTELPGFCTESAERPLAGEGGEKKEKVAASEPVAACGRASVSKYDGKGPLVVRVFSFSYRKGIPEDTSGNGGGYVFDCRSTHNPGRYESYKKLTGLDEPVIRFLEEDGEILTFLESVYKLADTHVERYMKRGFTDLMFAFGCTGGQHRSVYSAQHLAEHLAARFGIEIHVFHREQGIRQILPSRKG